MGDLESRGRALHLSASRSLVACAGALDAGSPERAHGHLIEAQAYLEHATRLGVRSPELAAAARLAMALGVQVRLPLDEQIPGSRHGLWLEKGPGPKRAEGGASPAEPVAKRERMAG